MRGKQKPGRGLIDADDDADRLILELNYSFIPQWDYSKMADTLEATYTGIRERVLGWQEEGILSEVYLPVFMNYGFYREDYWSRLRPESRASPNRWLPSTTPMISLGIELGAGSRRASSYRLAV